jgi:hypothetical protein
MKEDMVKGKSILHHHMKRLGLFTSEIWEQVQDRSTILRYHHRVLTASDTDRDKVFVDNADQGYVMFNRRFTYLGSIITNDLEDSAEIHAKIGKANGILHILNNLWKSKGILVSMKKQFYIARVMNIVLWGCESLTIQAVDLKKLEVFHHKAMRHILNITKRLMNELPSEKTGLHHNYGRGY